MESKTQSGELLNAKEIDIRRQIEYLRFLIQNCSAGIDIQRHTKTIINSFTNGYHRLIRLLSYNLVKELQDLDYSTIAGTISTDLSSNDPEIQLNAMKLLYILPVRLQLELLKSNEKDLNKILIIPDFHYERLICLNDFLLKTLVKSYSLDPNENYTIYEIYLKMAELIFHSSREISRNALEVFRTLYQQYKIGDFDIVKNDKYFEGNGRVRQIIRPLMIKLTNYFFPKLKSILQILDNFELRHCEIMMAFPIYLIITGLEFFSQINSLDSTDILVILGKKNLNLNMEGSQNISLRSIFKEIIYDYLLKHLKMDTCEFDLIIPTLQNIFTLLNITYKSEWSWLIIDNEKSEILKSSLMYFSNILKKISYKRELNHLILNFMVLSRYINDSYKLLFSIKIIEIVSVNNSVQNVIDKYLLYFLSFTNIITISLNLLNNYNHNIQINQANMIANKQDKNSNGQQYNSTMFSLFQQTWFIQKLNDHDDENVPIFKEELLVNLLLSCFLIKNKYTKKQKLDLSLNRIIQEVLDLSSRLIDWKMEAQSADDDTKISYLYAVDLYLLLLEDSFNTLNQEDLYTHIQEIIKRILGKQIIFDLKLKVLLTLSKKLDHKILKQLPVNDIIDEFRTLLINQNYAALFDQRLIQKLPSSKRLTLILNQIEIILEILYNFGIAYATNEILRLKLVTLFSDYQEHLNKINSLPTIFHPILASIIDFNEYITKFVLNNQNTNISHIKIATNFLDQIDFVQEEDANFLPYYTSWDNLCLAYNIYMMKIHSQPSHNHQIFTNDLFDNGRNIENLTILYEQLLERKIELNQAHDDFNYRVKDGILITGISECLQVYASHSLLPSQNLFCVTLKLVNITKFLIENIKVQALYNANLDIFPKINNPNFQIIDSISQTGYKSINFTFKINSIVDSIVYFEIIIDSNELENAMKIKAHPYNISFMDFLIPNYLCTLNELLFDKIWRNIPFHLLIHCQMKVAHQKVLDRLSKMRMSTIPLYQEGEKNKWYQVNMLAYTWDEKLFSILLIDNTNSSDLKEVNGISSGSNAIISIEIRSTNIKIIENIRDSRENFIKILGSGAFELLH